MESLKRDKFEMLAVLNMPNYDWFIDLMADQLEDDRSIQTVNVWDDVNRDGLFIDLDSSQYA